MFYKHRIVKPIRYKDWRTYRYLGTGFECRPHYLLDTDGIPLMDYGLYQYANTKGLRYNLGAVCQYALEVLFEFDDSPSELRIEEFRKAIDWMVARAASDSNGTRWYFDYDYQDVKAPWTSCLVSGLMLTALRFCHDFFPKAGYDHIAGDVAKFYCIGVDQGGFRIRAIHGHFYAQYTNCEHWRHYCLNGYITALLGLVDYCNWQKADLNTSSLLEESIGAFKYNFDKFCSLGIWTSLYPVREHGVSSSVDYHRLHVELLSCLGWMLNSPSVNRMSVAMNLFAPNTAHRIVSSRIGRRLAHLL
jgi:hypothetical protein